MGHHATNPSLRREPLLRAVGLEQAINRCVAFICAILLLAGIAAWSYWPTMADLVNAWQHSNDYSAGLIVPLLAAYLVWRKREEFRSCPPAPCWWTGAGVFILAEAIRVVGLLLIRPSIERYSLLFALTGLILMVAGRPTFRRVFWIWLFLFLMVPLPSFVHNLISGPLQGLATGGAVLLLDLSGAEVELLGNTVALGDDITLGIAEACSGLRMLTAFVVTAALAAFLVKRPRWQKGVLLVSSIPVAVGCNIFRISLTALIMMYASVELGGKFFHDYAPFVMMPVAVSLLFGEIWLMDRIVRPDRLGPGQNRIVTRTRPARQAPTRARPEWV